MSLTDMFLYRIRAMIPFRLMLTCFSNTYAYIICYLLLFRISTIHSFRAGIKKSEIVLISSTSKLFPFFVALEFL